MSCSTTSYKTFLVCSNVALLFIGVSILILGMKMKLLLSVVLLLDVPIIAQAVKAVIATGSFISVAGVTGITGACYEILWLIYLHLITLGIIVVMEFGLGVTLLIVKRSIENYSVSAECDKSCATVLDTVVLDYALPSAGLMMSIIIVEAVMIYSAIKLYFHIRSTPKMSQLANVTFVVRNAEMQNVASPLPGYMASPSPLPGYMASPLPGYMASPLPSYISSPHTPRMYTPQMNFLSQELTPSFTHHSAPPRYAQPSVSPKPPVYSCLDEDQQQPPSYLEVSAQLPKMDARANMNSV